MNTFAIERRLDAKCDVTVYIGRFQPFHVGHLSIIRQALLFSSALIIIIGSAGGPRSIHNPFTFDERRKMIFDSLPADLRDRVLIVQAKDALYRPGVWLDGINSSVMPIARHMFGEQVTVSLIGHAKDATSYYLKLFPQWGAISCPNVGGLSSTPMRESFFKRGGTWLDTVLDTSMIPQGTKEFLWNFSKEEAFFDLVEDYEECRAYTKKWGRGPFFTADAVVTMSGYELKVKRSKRPGRGLWAWPGGFVGTAKNPNETSIDAAIRELYEETNIDVPPGLLYGCVRASRIFDDPFRDPRAHIITNAFKIELPASIHGLPYIKAGDDAADAAWLHSGDSKESTTYADHHHIGEALKAMSLG